MSLTNASICWQYCEMVKHYNNNNNIYLSPIYNVHRGTSSVDYYKIHLQ